MKTRECASFNSAMSKIILEIETSTNLCTLFVQSFKVKVACSRKQINNAQPKGI